MVEFKIPIKGLSLDKHEYAYKIDKSFFDNYEFLEIEDGVLDLRLDLIKESTLLNLSFSFDGNITLKCDRCLDLFDLHLKNSYRLIVKYANDFEEISDEIISVPSSESNLDISQFVFEYINLMLPLKKVHPDEGGNKTCNKDMVKRIDSYSEQKNDPRWDALKNINLD